MLRAISTIMALLLKHIEVGPDYKLLLMHIDIFLAFTLNGCNIKTSQMYFCGLQVDYKDVVCYCT